MKRIAIFFLFILSSLSLFAQTFEKVMSIQDPDFGIADAVFFIDDATVGIYKDTVLEIIDINSGSKKLVRDGAADWIANYSFRPLIYYDAKNKKMARYEFGGELQDSGNFFGLSDLRVDWGLYDKMNGGLLFEKGSAESVYNRQMLSSADERQFLAIEYANDPLSDRMLKKIYWIDTGTQDRKEVPLIIPFSYKTLLDKKTFNIVLDWNEYGFVARSIWLHNRILVLDGESLKRAANEDGFYEKYVYTDKSDPILEKVNPYIGIYYYLEQTAFGFNNTKTAYGSKYVALKYQATSWPCRFKMINVETMTMDYLDLPLFYLFSYYAFDVSPKGNLLAFAEKDPKTGLFKQWSIYRIVLNGSTDENNVRLRKQPTTGGEIIAQLAKGTKVKVLDRTGAEETISGLTSYWYKVRLSNGTEGWMFGAWLKIEE